MAYAATGRLPFGVGAPDVVAFRVMSGEADLDGVPTALRGVVEKALSKEPADRPSAAEAAHECAVRLASEATQVGSAGSGPATAVDMVAAVWAVPAGDDPSWHLTADRKRPRKRLVGGLVLAAGVIGGLAGGVVALLPGDRWTDTHTSSVAASASSSSSAGSAQPSTKTVKGDTAARQQTASGDSAAPESWNQARAAQGAGEHDVARALLHDEGVEARDLGDGIDFAPGTVRFHESRREVYLSYTLASDEEGALYAETEIARTMCLSLRDVVLRLHPDLPYHTYVMVKTQNGRDPQVMWQDDFVTNTECRVAADDGTGQGSDATTQDWQPDEDGLGQAMIPSTDRDEIRVADGATRQIIAGANGMRQSLDTDHVLGNEEIKVGFDPVDSVMYVWSDYVRWNEQQVESWADMAAGRACRALVRQSQSSGGEWPYHRYAVAEIGGSGYLMIRWGTAAAQADCPA
ncbi:hypothetical protein [Streptomyces sp. NPDC056628]|uniref:hypothetical protein n=1 Tax=Streptomyces sp. NPDC056628 TaxID=3345882 RepID=UPI0036BAC69E